MEVATRFALLLAKQTNWSSIKIAPLPKKLKKLQLNCSQVLSGKEQKKYCTRFPLLNIVIYYYLGMDIPLGCIPR